MSNVQIPTSESLLTDKKPSAIWFMFFQKLWRAVRGNIEPLKLGGMLNANSTSLANEGTSLTSLISYDLSGKILVNNGDTLEIKAWGSFASNANSKTLNLIFGTQTIASFTGNFNGGNWQFKSIISIKDSSTQEIIIELLSNNTTIQSDLNYPLTRIIGTQDIQNSLTIECEGQGGATDDIIQYALIINLFPNN